MSLILTLDQSGQPHGWSDWQTAVCYEAKGMITWSMGEIAFVAHGGKSRLTGEQSVITVPSIISVKTKFHPKYKTPVLTNKNLFRRDLYICAYCGESYIESKLTRDHIIPVSRWYDIYKNGNPDTWTNVVTACKKCNNEKDDWLLEEIGMQLLYVPYTPDRNEHLILKNRHIRADQMDFIKNFLPPHSRAGKLLTV